MKLQVRTLTSLCLSLSHVFQPPGCATLFWEVSEPLTLLILMPPSPVLSMLQAQAVAPEWTPHKPSSQSADRLLLPYTQLSSTDKVF